MVREVNEFLKELNVPIVNKKNIIRKHFRNTGLYLNMYAVAKLAMSVISTTRKFWQPFEYLNNTIDSKPIKEAETFIAITLEN